MLNSLWSLISEFPLGYVALEGLAVLSAIHAICHVRTAQAAVAWVVGLLALPLLALPLYWVFGRYRFQGYLEAIRQVEERHRHSVEAIRRELATPTNKLTTVLDTPLDQLADVLDTPLSWDNEFDLLVNGEAFLDRLLADIRSAEHYVYASFYILRGDATGRAFADCLIERARAGVVVRVLYDELGCWRLSRRYLQRLRAAGVEIRAFNTQQRILRRIQLNFRNHRKLLVVDGRKAIVGGLNIGDEYLGRTKWFAGWRDTAVAVQGPLARKIQAVFARDYFWSARSNLLEALWSPPDERAVVDAALRPQGQASAQPQSDSAPQSRVSGSANQFAMADSRQEAGDFSKAKQAHTPQHRAGCAAVFATGPADARPRATMMFAAAAHAARRRLWISTPYLVPDATCQVALSMARARGVDVRVLIPSVADHLPVYLAGFHYEQELTEAGIDVYRYRTGLMHQKCVLVDDSLALVGSTNLDNRSLHLNFELMVGVEDPEVVRQVAAMLEIDFEAADRKGEGAARQRPWLEQVGTIVARLFSPVL